MLQKTTIFDLTSINNLFEEISSFNSQFEAQNSDKILSVSNPIISQQFLFFENLLNKSRKWEKMSKNVNEFLSDPKNADILTFINHSKITSSINNIIALVHIYGFKTDSEQMNLLWSTSKTLAEINDMVGEKKQHDQKLDEMINQDFYEISNEIVTEEAQNKKVSGWGLFSSFFNFNVLSTSAQEPTYSLEEKEFEEVKIELIKLIGNRKKIDRNCLIDEIVAQLKDKNLHTTKKYIPLNGKFSKNVPQLFHDDSIRINGLSYNGDNFYSVKKGINENVKEELIFRDDCNSEIPECELNRKLIIDHLIAKLGKPLFNKIGIIINQAFNGKVIDDVVLLLHLKIISINEYQGLETRTITKYEIVHDKKNGKIGIFARILFENAFIQNKSKLLGFWGFRREITIPCEDLIHFKDFSPNLDVKESVTDLMQDKKSITTQLKLKIQ